MIFLLVRWATSLYVLFLVSFSPVLSGDDAKDDSFLFLDFFPFIEYIPTFVYDTYYTQRIFTSLPFISPSTFLFSSLVPYRPTNPIPSTYIFHSHQFCLLRDSRIPLDMFQDGAVRAQYSHPTSYNTTDTDNTFTYNYSHHTPLLSSLTSRQVF